MSMIYFRSFGDLNKFKVSLLHEEATVVLILLDCATRLKDCIYGSQTSM